MTADDFPEVAPTRPIWLTTLADLGLLLVGFFVFVQATQRLDHAALAKGFRDGFGVSTSAPQPMPVAAAAMPGFAPGSAALPASPGPLIAWARDATRDPRVTLRIAGSSDGTPADVDPGSNSGAVLAADRARAVATILARSGVVPPERMTILNAPETSHSRGVVVTSAFAGERQ